MHDTNQFTVMKLSESYWKVRFQNGPINLWDVDSLEELSRLLDTIEAAPSLTVVVFESGNPDFFIAHWDFLADKARVAGMQPGPTGFHPYADTLARLSRVPVVTISSIHSRVRGAGSEFVLATDIRFASENALLGQFEVGTGAVPGGAAMARLARLVGRGRAIEILLGGDDIPAKLAELYGYVNRVVPEDELDTFVDTFARRIAGFDKVAVSKIKHFIDIPTLPTDEELGQSLAAFFETAGRPENRWRVTALFERGLQKPDGIELNLGNRLAEIAPEEKA